MNLYRITWRYLMWRPVITLLIIGSIAVGAGLISSVLTVRRAVDDMFLRDSSLVDLVVGGKGSPLQLILSSVYHLDVPTGNIPLKILDELRANKRVEQAIPLSLGDSVLGFRIVGTDESLFQFTERKSDESLLQINQGRLMQAPFDAVLGADAARGLGLALNGQFVGSHGLVQSVGASSHDEHPYTVVGILKPTGSALDRLVLTPLESVWSVHDKGIADRAPREITSALVVLKTPGLRLWVADEIQRETEAMAAIPIMEMLRLQQRLLNPLTRALLIISLLVVIVSALSIAISMVLTADRRQRDWKILRNLGARPCEILTLLLLESTVLSTLGVLIGAGVIRCFLMSLDGAELGLPGLQAASLVPSRMEVLALVGVALTGVVASFIPACIAYQKAPEVR